MVWYCLVFYGIAWYCLIFYGIVRCCLLRLQHSIRSCTTAEEAAGLNLAFIAIITLIIIIFLNDYLFEKTAFFRIGIIIKMVPFSSLLEL